MEQKRVICVRNSVGFIKKHSRSILGGIHSLYSFLYNLQGQWGHHLRQHTGGSSFVLVVTSSTSGENNTHGIISYGYIKQVFVEAWLMWFHTSQRFYLHQHSTPLKTTIPPAQPCILVVRSQTEWAKGLVSSEFRSVREAVKSVLYHITFHLYSKLQGFALIYSSSRTSH